MNNTNHEELSYVDKHKSLSTTSTSIRRINDNGPNTASSVFTHNSSTHSLSFNVCISINHSSSELDVHKLSSTTPSFTLNNNVSKLNKTSTDEQYISTPLLSTNQEISIKMNVFSDMRIRSYTLPMHDVCLSVKDTNSRLHKYVYNKRIALDGLNKIDFMYYLTKRHYFVPVTEKIFSFLQGEDIALMTKVSRIWRDAIKCSPLARRKQKSYLISVKENHRHVVSVRSQPGFRPSFPNRKALCDISNVMCFASKKKKYIKKNLLANLDSS